MTLTSVLELRMFNTSVIKNQLCQVQSNLNIKFYILNENRFKKRQKTMIKLCV